MADQNCAHEACDCEVEEGKGVTKDGELFCSNHCANTGTSAADSCECGHEDCE